MSKYILRRLVAMIPVLLGVALITFCMMYFSPGEPAKFILGDMATEEDIAIFNEQNGLNDPFLIQFINYIRKAITGDLGISYTTKQPVLNEILSRFPTTFKLTLISIVFAVIIGVFFGIISAVKQYGIIDNVTRIIAMLGVSMPSFWEGLMLIILFSVILGILPSSGITTWKHWILPAFTLSTQTLAACMRMTRSSMLEEIRQDYVRTAKGQKEYFVILFHAFRNAVLPIITVVGVDFAKLMGGAAVIEIVFSIPGIGKLIVDAINTKNAPLVQGGILFVAFTMSFINLITDIIYAFVDPRIKTQYLAENSKKNKQEKEVGSIV
jgi:peptide/nickel transport system permease protein